MTNPTPQTRVRIVVPCYNEASRIVLPKFREYLNQNSDVDLLFVNDGSTDDTRELLTKFCADHQRCSILNLPRNCGKGEATRQGIMHSLSMEAPEFVGFWDADLATPLDVVGEFIEVFDANPQLVMVVGARVKLMGRAIKRRMLRHYTGRVFATLASMALGLAVYDTQCGAKLFRVSDQLTALFSSKFASRWVFDVEIFARLKHEYLQPADELIFEYPLRRWEDIGGSKLRPHDFAFALRDLSKIWWTYR